MLLHEPRKFRVEIYREGNHDLKETASITAALPDLPLKIKKFAKGACCWDVFNPEGDLVLWQNCKEG